MQNQEVETKEKAQVNDSQSRANESQEQLSRDIWDGLKSGGFPNEKGGGEGGNEPGLKGLPHCTIEVDPKQTKITCENGGDVPDRVPSLPNDPIPSLPDNPHDMQRDSLLGNAAVKH